MGVNDRDGYPFTSRYCSGSGHGGHRLALCISDEQIGGLVPGELQKKQALSLLALLGHCFEALVSNLSAVHGSLCVGIRVTDSRAFRNFGCKALTIPKNWYCLQSQKDKDA
jgi:hypothetical protein